MYALHWWYLPHTFKLPPKVVFMDALQLCPRCTGTRHINQHMFNNAPLLKDLLVKLMKLLVKFNLHKQRTRQNSTAAMHMCFLPQLIAVQLAVIVLQ